jgi:predicted AlkP superfamily pyrophosphatase or phosphodiesterase
MTIVNSAMFVAMRKAFFLLLLTPLWLDAAPVAHHVVVIALDGCRPELLRDHSTGALRQLWAEGAYTWEAQAVVPSVTQVNFASILTSCTPEKHGITQVAWNHDISPQLRVKVTTLFEVLATQRLGAVAMLGHEKLYPVEKVASGTIFLHSPGGTKAAAPIAAEHLQKAPAFTFVYFGDLDGEGHRSGWLSPEQIRTMGEINRGVDLVVAAIRQGPMNGKTVVIVTSDHGGHGKAHSAGTPEDRTIPWVCWGAGVKAGPLPPGVQNMDTAATALHVLGVRPPAEWDGRAITEAFTR